MFIHVGSGIQNVDKITCLCTFTNRSSSLGKKIVELQKTCEDKVIDYTNHKKKETVILRDDGVLAICPETASELINQIQNLDNSETPISFVRIDNIWFDRDKIEDVLDLRSMNRKLEVKLRKMKKENKAIVITRNRLKQSAIFFKNGNAVICSVSKKDVLDKLNYPESESTVEQINSGKVESSSAAKCNNSQKSENKK